MNKTPVHDAGPPVPTPSLLTPTRPPAVVAEALSRRFGDFLAVDGVSFEVAPGEIFGFLGPNGAGKTTTLRMLLGLLQPTSGRATVLGYDVARQAGEVQQRIGYMSQRFSLYGDLTVAENLRFYGQVYGLGGQDLARRRAEALVMTGLEGREGALARDLAGGFRQRLALACATLHDPRVLFLDEPTSGVDPISRRRFWDYLYDLADAGRSLFVTTHYMDEAENCRRLAFIDGGRLVAEGSPAALKAPLERAVLELEAERPELALAALRAALAEGRLPPLDLALHGSRLHLVGQGAADLVAPLTAILVASGARPGEIALVAPSLEDVFMSRLAPAGGRETRSAEGGAV